MEGQEYEASLLLAGHRPGEDFPANHNSLKPKTWARGCHGSHNMPANVFEACTSFQKYVVESQKDRTI